MTAIAISKDYARENRDLRDEVEQLRAALRDIVYMKAPDECPCPCAEKASRALVEGRTKRESKVANSGGDGGGGDPVGRGTSGAE